MAVKVKGQLTTFEGKREGGRRLLPLSETHTVTSHSSLPPSRSYSRSFSTKAISTMPRPTTTHLLRVFVFRGATFVPGPSATDAIF